MAITDMTFLYQDIAQPIPPPFPETVTEDRWHQPWSEPIRRIFAVALIASGPFAPIPPPSDLSFHQPWSEPTRLVRRAIGPTLADGYFTSADLSFNKPWAEPTRALTRQLGPELAYGYFTPSPPVAPAFGWFTKLSDPIFNKQARVEQSKFLAYEYFPVTPIGWMGPFSEPTSILQVTYQSAQEPPYAVVTPTVPSFGWYEKLSDPVRARSRLTPTEFSWGYFTPPPVVNFGWFSPLSEPTLQPERPTPAELAYGYFTPTPPVVPSFGWFAEFSLPTFTVKLRLSVDTAWGYFTPPPIPPIPPVPVIGSFSIGPQMITGQGSPPGEVYIQPPKKGKKGKPKGTRIASDYPKWPGWGKY